MIQVSQDLDFFMCCLLMLWLKMSQNDFLNNICELIFQRSDTIHDSIRTSPKLIQDFKVAHLIPNALWVYFSCGGV
jgi:hypothetical protein